MEKPTLASHAHLHMPHVRSISFPSRSHPSTLRIEQELNKFKTLDALSNPSTGSICAGLSQLEELYQCMDDLLNMGSTQQVLSHNQNKKCIEELLDGSVRLLDVCEITKDMLLQIKEHVQALQSALRRRKGDSSTESTISTYISFRKKMKKDSKRLFAALKQTENKLGASPISDHDHHLSAVILVLGEVNMTSISIFQSLLLFLSMPVSKPRQGKWFLVSKLMHKGVIACEEKQEILNELELVDAAMCEGLNVEKMQITNKRLEALETSIQELENGLETVFRHLIKARASVLNIISQ